MSYGPLNEVVAGATSVLSAAAALTAWSRWDRLGLPDVGVSKMTKSGAGSVVNAVGIAVLYVATRSGRHHSSLAGFSIWLAIGTFLGFLALAAVVGLLGLDLTETAVGGTYVDRTVLGGLWVSKDARKELRAGVSRDDYFRGVEFKLGNMFPRVSLVLARSLVLVLYFSTVLAGSLALASAGRLLANVRAGF